MELESAPRKKKASRQKTGRTREEAPRFAFWKSNAARFELELELIQTQMAQKPMLRAEVGMRVRCANKASAE